MKRIKNFTLGILGVSFLSLGLYACSNDEEVTTTNNTMIEQAALAATMSTGEIPEEEKHNIYQYFIEYYNMTDELEVLLVKEDLDLDTEFTNRLEEIENEYQLLDLLVEYNFSNPDTYISKLQKISNLQINLKENNKVFFSLSEAIRERIMLDIAEVSFNDFYNPITLARTCKEQYDIDVNRAKKTYAGCGAVAVVTAGISGGLGGLVAGAGCMYNYYNDLNNAAEDYNDCVNG